MNPMKITLWLAIAFLPLSALAGREGNGGDPAALEFQKSALQAIQDIQSEATEYPAVKAAELSAIVLRLKILVVSDPLFVKKEGVSQESAAVNYPDIDTIYLNRARWKEITNPDVRRALALHELLGLAGLESSGSYPISQKYLVKRGENCRPEICLNPPREISFTYKEAARVFNDARMPTEEEMLGSFKLVARIYEPDWKKAVQLTDAKYAPGGYDEIVKFEHQKNFTQSETFLIATEWSGNQVSESAKIVSLSEGANAACYSTFASESYYDDDSVLQTRLTKDYFSHECRVLANDPDQMICNQIFVMNDPIKGAKESKKFHRRSTRYEAYTRVKK